MFSEYAQCSLEEIAEQYIELKNKLSECIVESAGQLQELAHDLVEGFR